MSRFNLIGIEVDLKYILIHTCIINTCILSFKSALISPFNFLSISPLKFACIYKLSLWYKNRAKPRPNSVFVFNFLYAYKGLL